MGSVTNTDENKPLSNQEQVFADHYLLTLNVREAAAAAGYSDGIASTDAYSWVKGTKKPNVAKYIRDELTKRSKRTRDAADEALIALINVVKFDIRTIINDDGTIKPPSQWGDEAAAAIGSLEVNAKTDKAGKVKASTSKVKLWDKPGTAEKLLRALGKMGQASEPKDDELPPADPDLLSPREVAMRVAFLLTQGSK